MQLLRSTALRAAGKQWQRRGLGPVRAVERPARAIHAAASLGLFVCSGSPAIAEAMGHAGADWICIDAQHGAVG